MIFRSPGDPAGIIRIAGEKEIDLIMIAPLRQKRVGVFVVRKAPRTVLKVWSPEQELVMP